MPTVKKEIYYLAESEEYAEELLSLFKLKEFENMHSQALSEGQKRRLSIAVVLASKPKVILLDEPTVGQDYETLNNLINILNKIHNETKNTMITVSHDRRCVGALADKIVIIKDGVVDKIGNKDLALNYFK